MPTVASVGLPRFQAFDNNGKPLRGGKLYTYLAGSTTLAPTYTDATGAVANTNPVVLNARGEGVVYLDVDLTYKWVLTAPDGTVLRTDDYLSGNNLSGVASEFVQAGTGSVPRSFSDKLAERISVTDKGASPGASAARNALAFQAAIDQAAITGAGVLVPAGAYDLNPINLREGVALYGDGSTNSGYSLPVVAQLRYSGTTTPLITARKGSAIRGLSFFDPTQTASAFTTNSNAPLARAPMILVPDNEFNVTIERCNPVNAYVFVKCGDGLLNGQAVGRVEILNNVGYALYSFVEITEARDVIRVIGNSTSAGYYDVTQAGAGGQAGTMSNWTLRNGAFIRSDTCDGLMAFHNFVFATRVGIDVFCSNPTATIDNPGLTQYLDAAHNLWDGTPTVLRVRDGGWVIGDVTGGTQSCLNGTPFDNSGDYPSVFEISSNATGDGRLGIDINCSGAVGRFLTYNGTSLKKLTVRDKTVLATHRAVGASGVFPFTQIFVGDTANKLTFEAHCRFDGSLTSGIQSAVYVANALAVILGGSADGFFAPFHVELAGSINTSSELLTVNTSGPSALAIGQNYAGRFGTNDGNYDKRPDAQVSMTPRASVVVGSGQALVPGGAVITYTLTSYDNSTAMNNGTGTWTCQSRAYYRYQFRLATAGMDAGDVWQVDLLKNGTAVRNDRSTPNRLFLCGEIDAVRGDTLQFAVRRISGSGTTPTIANTPTINEAEFALIA